MSGYAGTRERPHVEPTRDSRSIATLIGNLARDLSVLVRQELQLARVETTENLSRMTSGAVVLGVGALIAWLGLQALCAAAILVLALYMEAWIAAVVVGIVVLVIGAILALTGRGQLRRARLVPERSLQSLKADADMVREQIG